VAICKTRIFRKRPSQKLVNVEREAVARWVSGIRRPRPHTANKIREVTKGWIKVADFY